MTPLNITKLLIDWRRLWLLGALALYLPLLNLELGLPIAFAGLCGTAVIVGAYTADPNRFRLYGLSRATTIRTRIFMAALLGAFIVLSLLPGALSNGSRNALFCAVGAVIGLSVQALRRPEDNFGARQFFFAAETARGVRFDIIVRPQLMWYAIIPFMVVIYPLIIGRGKGEIDSLLPAMMGFYGPMLGGHVVLVKNQLLVSRIFGRAATCVVRDLRRSSSLVVFPLILSTIVTVLWTAGQVTWYQLLPLISIGLAMHAALFIGAFRRLGTITPILVFVGIVATMILASMATASAALCAWHLAVVFPIWLFALFLYAPRRARTGVFGSSGLRETFGTANKVAL